MEQNLQLNTKSGIIDTNTATTTPNYNIVDDQEVQSFKGIKDLEGFAPDTTVEDVGQVPMPGPSIGLPLDVYGEAEEKARINKAVDEASYSEKTKAWFMQFGNNNMLNEGLEKATDWLTDLEAFEDNPDFISKNTDDRVSSLLNVYGLQADDFLKLRKARSLEHGEVILQRLLKQKSRNKFLQETLGGYGTASAAIAGSLIDIDLLLIAPLTGAKFGTNVSKIVKTTAGVETAGAYIKSQIRDDYDIKDGIIDITLGTMVDTVAAKYFAKQVRGAVDLSRTRGSYNGDLINDVMKTQTDSRGVTPPIDLSKDLKPQLSLPNKRKDFVEVLESHRTVQQTKEYLDIDKQLTDIDNQLKKINSEFKFRNAEYKKLRDEKLPIATKGAKNSDNPLALKAVEDLKQAIGRSKEQVDITNAKKAELKRTKESLETSKKALVSSIRNENIIKATSDMLSKNIDDLKAKVSEMEQVNSPQELLHIREDLTKVLDDLAKDFPDDTKEIRKVLKKPSEKAVSQLRLSNRFTKPQKLAIAAALLSGTSLMAGDGEEVSFLSTVAGIIIAGALVTSLGKGALRHIRNPETRLSVDEISNSIKEKVSLNEYRYSEDGQKTLGYIGALHEKLNTAFNSSYKEIINTKDAEAIKIANELLFNPISGKVGSADVEKAQMLHGDQARVNGALNVGYVKWLQQRNVKGFDSFLEDTTLRSMFNKEVSDMIEGSVKTPDYLKPVVQEVQDVIKQVLKYATEAEVLGANRVIPKDNYLPRLYKFDVLFDFFKGADQASKDVMISNLAAMIKGPDSYNTAKQLSEWFTNAKNYEGMQSDEVYERLADLFMEGVEKDEVTKKLLTASDKASRFKDRLEMDLTKFNSFPATIKGKQTTISLDTIIERDIGTVMDKYLNQAYGSIALAKREYPSVNVLRKKISTIGNADAREALSSVLDLILGLPIKTQNAKANEFVTTVKGLTFTVAMPLVAFSMIPEVLKTISYAGLPKVLDSFRYQIKKMDKNTELYKQLSETTGLGTHTVRDKLDFRGITMQDIGELGVKTWHARMAKGIQEKVARYSGLIAGSDILQRAVMAKSRDNLARFVNGLDHEIPMKRLESYGLDDKVINMFKDDFKFNSNNELLAVDMKSWSYAKRTKFNDILFRMNQEITPEVALGTVGRWTKDMPIGQMLSFLVSYPINLYANQAVKDVKFWDARTLSNTVMTFAGTYIGLVMKYEALERDYEHEDLVKYSLMNLPSLALLGAVGGVMDNATVQKMAEVKKDVEVLVSESADTLLFGK